MWTNLFKSLVTTTSSVASSLSIRRSFNTLWHMHTNTLWITGVRPIKKSKMDEQPTMRGEFSDGRR